MAANRIFTVDGLRLAALEEGSGPPVLFVHGFPVHHGMWREQSTVCRGYRAIAPDLRGFGASEASNEPTPMDRFAADLHAILDQLKMDEPIVYVGLSMGGYIFWPFFEQRPDRVRAVVLANTRVIADAPETAQSRRETAARVLREGVQVIEASMIEKLFSPVTRSTKQEVIQEARSMIRQAAPEGVAGALLGTAERPDVSDRLSSLSIPTLVIAGDDDGLSSPTEMEGFSRAIPGAEIVRVERAGHMTPMENPSAFNGALSRFLERVTPT